MVMIIPREQMIAKVCDRWGADNLSTFLMLENVSGHKPSSWFATISPISIKYFESTNSTYYWDWCETHCTGQLLCYYIDDIDQEECWGFTEYDDIIPWMLKWA
jgi:hypothetical protein